MRAAALVALLVFVRLGAACGAADRYFTIKVVDEQTGRGVPLVELRTVHGIRHYTDSNGIVAFHEPGLMDSDVFFHVSSHGYAFPADGFGMAGKRLHVAAGASTTLRLERRNIAERLYRVTGGGIYRDSVLAGAAVPIAQPVLNGRVVGQDSVINAVFDGRLYWFWGDTSWAKYPLGNFHAAGATSRLPGNGGLDPGVGVNLTYFVREDGFAKEMAPHDQPGPVWLSALVVLPEASGVERMYAAYSQVTSEMKALERGFMRYDETRDVFERVTTFDVAAPLQPGAHPFVHAVDGVAYIWFPDPFPQVRVRATVDAYLDVAQYEAWTPLQPGSRLDDPVLDRDEAGWLCYAWRRNTPALDRDTQRALIDAGKMRADEAWVQLQDVDTGKGILPHAGSVYWNAHRQRWITIRCEILGTSLLGETWYAEADTPLGPWVYARKIVTHDRYTFYNPKQHPMLDQAGGRIVYFEGTYANTFSGNPQKTPRYDYNQIMYRLDLDDSRLVLPVPVYAPAAPPAGASLRTRNALPADAGPQRIAFFALDRPKPGSVAVRRVAHDGDASRLVVANSGDDQRAQQGDIAFHALPADVKDPPATSVPLYEYQRKDRVGWVYSTESDWSDAAYQRSGTPLCRVWRSPPRADLRWSVRR